MLKFLRKYNTWILAIGGALLMVAFVAPQAITQLGPKPENRAVAFLDGKKVTDGELRIAAGEKTALHALTPALMAFGIGLSPDDPADHWYLLTKAAERGGFVAEAEDGRDWIQEIARQTVEWDYENRIFRIYGVFQDLDVRLDSEAYREDIIRVENQIINGLPQAAGQGKLTLLQINHALAKARGVMRMFDAYNNSPRFSELRAVAAAKRAGDTAFADMVWVSGARAAVFRDEVSAEQVAEHYERFRDVSPEESEFGVGYLQPDRIKLAWLELDPDLLGFDVEAQIDPVEIAKRHRRDSVRYPGTLEEERAGIVRAIRDEEVGRIIAEAERVLRERTAAAQRAAEDGAELPDNWDELCPSWTQLSDEIVASVKEATGYDITPPAVARRESRWLTGEDVLALPGIGSSAVRVGSQILRFDQAALGVDELNDASFSFRVGVPSIDNPAIFQETQKRFYFTVTEAREESPPDSLEEVQEEARDGAARMAAYEELLEKQDALLEQAKAEGFESVANAYSPDETDPDYDPEADGALLKLNVQRAIRVQWTEPRVTTNVPQVITEGFADAVMERATTIDPLLREQAIPDEQAWIAVPVPENLGLALVRINGFVQVTEETFRRTWASALQRARRDELITRDDGTGGSPFTFESLSERLGYEAIRGDEREKEPAADEQG